MFSEMIQEVNLVYIFETEPIYFARKRPYNSSTQAEHFCVDRSNNNEGCNVSFGGNMILKPDLPSTEKCTRCGQLMLAMVPLVSAEDMVQREPITDCKGLIASYFDLGKITRFEITEKEQFRPLGNRKAFTPTLRVFFGNTVKAKN